MHVSTTIRLIGLGLSLWLQSLMAPLSYAASPSPRLVVAISVDQFSADLFNKHRAEFAYGLKRLQQGAVFSQGYQSHAATETCPGHSTILTGSRPARTGIIANEWVDQSLERTDKQVYCSEDPQLAGTDHSNYVASAQFLKVPTLGDRLKAVSPQSRVVSVAGKDRAALMLGGHNTDEVWFYNGSQYVTLKGRTQLPAVVQTVNQEINRALAYPNQPALPAMCARYSVPLPVGSQTIGVLQAPPAKDGKAFRTSLEFDRLTTDVALGLMHELKLGQGPAVDVLAIGLSATDYVGHAFGTDGAEMCAQVAQVDQQVGRILDALDQSHVPYVVMLTADHGAHDAAERNQRRAFLSDKRMDYAVRLSYINGQLAQKFKLEPPVLLGVADAGDLYVNRAVPKALVPKVLAEAKKLYLAQPQVQTVLTHAQIAQVKPATMPVDEWTVEQRLAASFTDERSGDLVVVFKPMVAALSAGPGYVATHGSPWNYDRRVPILFYEPTRAGFEQTLPVETVDILPTLAALIHLKINAAEIDGRCLDIDPGEIDTCQP
jgi:predicted AlkP superfamily pyrophosphatase or phosphodiesterase